MKNFSFTVIRLTALVLLSGCQTRPGLGLNEEASVQTADDLPENPLLLHGITSGVHPANGTMFTLYGNDTAFFYAGGNSDNRYPDGAVLYEVTWRQQEDEQWVGASIPKKIIAVERVAYVANEQPTYTLYQGTPLKKTAVANPGLRIAIISGQRMAVSP